MKKEAGVLKEITIVSDAPGEKLFMLGNEAIARGAIEAGVNVAAAYPGTPSSEILGTLSSVAKAAGMYVEWSTNEIVAFEVAMGASVCGLRGLSCMKHVGVNVAHDALMTAGYWGAIGGLVLLAADDPSQWSSQNEQDTRYFGPQGYLPILEPSTPQEAKDMIVDAFKYSEDFGHPFIVRTVMRVSHGRSDVVLGEISKEKRQGDFPKGAHFLVGPAKDNRQLMIDRFQKIREAVDSFPGNQLKLTRGAKLGIIACGLSYSYTLEAIRELGLEDKVSMLKIGTPYPLPAELVKKLLSSVEEVLVVEELEPFVETYVKAIAGETGITVKIHGKDLLPLRGELSPRLVTEALTKLTATKSPVSFASLDKLEQEVAPLVPVRPPALCAGCPHRASFHIITTAGRRIAREDGLEPIYPSDIGCYIMVKYSTIKGADCMVCMGGGFGISNGLVRSIKNPIISHLGDSTFFHAAIPAVINAVFNKAKITMIVLDNSTTAMTGFQPHPGTGYTAMGEETAALKPEDIARACGVKFVEVIDPFGDLKKAVDTVVQAAKFDGPSFLVFRRVCAQIEIRDKRRTGEEIVPYYVDPEKCNEKCSTCIKLFGCPALLREDGKTTIDTLLCTGCGVCAQICPYRAIVREQKK